MCYTLICSWCICTCNSTNQSVPNQEKFFHALGAKVRQLRKKRGYSQEDTLSFGFSTRHWQQVEAGRPITVTTLLRICEVLEISMDKLVRGLDEGIYETPTMERIPQRRKRRT
jgi:transcriptional regulator with XRE-family HTH domain